MSFLYPQQVEDVYRNNGQQLVWFDLQQSSQLEFQLELIEQSGVSPLISQLLHQLRFYRKSNQWYRYDLLATDALITYMSYAEQAKHQGKKWFFEEKIVQPLPVPSEAALQDLDASIQSQQLDAFIDAYTPDSDDYQA
ncbi:L,D-transpeptidase YcbB [Vibrio ponticus]|nr:L,D-transpeptidase YcbB [Vibrio ponticus]